MVRISLIVPLMLALAACGGEGQGGPAANASAAAPDAAPDPVQLADDAALANEAAESEAADMEAYGGEAAAPAPAAQNAL